ncbi:MAG TPA: VOC family protein [Bacillota bacterium]|jgi:catechol 2,3-dioxygenase-like lactoylglutathione lyase family enzyme|nr:VOC family protein [Bacillota bacterium]
MKYVCSLIVVEDIERSRAFYEQILQQKVLVDFGANVSFEGGFAIHLKEHYEKLIGGLPPVFGSHSFELYFETDAIDEIERELKKEGAEFLHNIEEQPWGQRVLRVYDPDRHIVDVGETMESLVARLHGQGKSVDEIHQKTSLPREYVEMLI